MSIVLVSANSKCVSPLGGSLGTNYWQLSEVMRAELCRQVQPRYEIGRRSQAERHYFDDRIQTDRRRVPI